MMVVNQSLLLQISGNKPCAGGAIAACFFIFKEQIMRVFLSLVVLFAVSAFAQIDSSAGSAWEYVASTTNVRVTGTTAGAVFTKQAIEPGWDYTVQFQDSVGAAADSAFTTCIVYGLDNVTVMSSSVVQVHRSGDARYKTCRLPVGWAAFGKSFSLTFTRYAATNKTNIVRAELIKRSPMSTNIGYKAKH